MIEISSAVSSSMSSTRAGIVAWPAIWDARQRRSPAISWYRPSSTGRTRIGLQDAVLADGRGELLERRLVERESRLLRVGVDAIDGDRP